MLIDGNTIFKSATFEDETLSLAFSELSLLVSQSTGAFFGDLASLAIVFEVSCRNGFEVIVDGDELKFAASSSVGILHAVYAFAEEFLGFCFFEPGKDTLLKQESIQLDDGVVISKDEPLLKNRGLIQEFPFSDESYRLADWMAKNRLNYLMTWIQYYDEMSSELKEYFHQRGISIECGHHSFEYWMPAQKYYYTHPEFFAIIDGKRIEPKTNPEGFLHGGQLCASNPQLRVEIAKNMIAYCKANPLVKIVSLVPNDGFGWCECEQCKKFYDTNEKGDYFNLSKHVYLANRLYHDMFKEVASLVSKELPDIEITLVAYVNYTSPSDGFELKKNNSVHFANYWRCTNHLMNSDVCPINSKYKQALNQWVKAKRGGSVNIYEYLMAVNLYLSLPMLHHEKIFDEINYYHDIGVDGFLTQFHLEDWTAYGLNYYMMAKAMSGESKSVIDETFRKLFRDSFDAIKQFYSKMEAITNSVGDCLVTYPYFLLLRTKLDDYADLLNIANEMQLDANGNSYVSNMKVWAEYLYRFKSLFDDYKSGRDVVDDIDGFYDWIVANDDKNIFVMKNVGILFSKWKERIKEGRPWLHYNLDWEDECILHHNAIFAD